MLPKESKESGDAERAQVSEDGKDKDSATSSTPFPSVIANTSPDSNATVSSALTYSDKLSALPSSMGSPNLNRGGRSPLMSSHGQSPRMFRHSLDASRSWPSISQPGIGNNLESFSGLSPDPANDIGTWHGKDDNRPRASTSDGSLNLEHHTPLRTSMESDRSSLPTVQSVKQVMNRLRRGSDPAAPSPALRGDYSKPDSPSPSHSRSRATSPLRIFQQWSQGISHRPRVGHHEEPFVLVDPFESQFRFTLPTRLPRFRLPNWLQQRLNGRAEGLPTNMDYPTSPPTVATHHFHAENINIATTAFVEDHHTDYVHHSNLHIMGTFFFNTLPRVIYLYLLLRIPSMYFSRVARVFQDAEVSKPDIQKMIDACGRNGSHLSQGQGQRQDNSKPQRAGQTNANANTIGTGLAPSARDIAAAAASVVDLPLPSLPLPEEWSSPSVSPALVRFKLSWESFIDSLMREWKTLNVVSALLLSAILTMFQINDAATDPLTRTAALLSLVCALMSLSYGCIYIVRFGTMRSMYRASIWAEEAQKTKTLIWWNVWILLGMPAVWMSWSMILFIISILSFVWRTGAESDSDSRSPLSDKQALGPRIAITFVFLLGMVYFFLIVRTLKSYGRYSERRGGMGEERGRKTTQLNGNGNTNQALNDITRRRNGLDTYHARMNGLRKEEQMQAQLSSTPNHDRGRQLHVVDVVADVIRGREPKRNEQGRSRKGAPYEQPRPRRPLFGPGISGVSGRGGGDVDLEKGVFGHSGMNGNMELI